MVLNDEDVRNIARLARLQIDEADIPLYTTELSRVFDLVEQLDKVNIRDIIPMAHPADAVQRLRTDEVTEQNQREKFQKLAPMAESGLYLVPKVIE